MKTFLFMTFFSLTFLSLKSQDSESTINPEWHTSGDITYALFLGGTTNTLIKDDDFDEEDNPNGNGILAGFQAEYYLGKNWSIRGRLNYERRDYSSGIDENYIAVPIMFAWHFGKNRRWNLQLGPAYSFSLGGTLKSNVGADFGIGVIIPIGGLKFFLELDGISDSETIDGTFTDLNGNVTLSDEWTGNRSSFTMGLYF